MVAFISYASAAANSVTLGTFAPGDYCLVQAFNTGSTTVPSLPAGWTNAGTSTAGTMAVRYGYRLLLSGDTTTGTWTNSTKTLCAVYRGVRKLYIASGNNGTAVSLINYAAYSAASMHSATGSWIVGLGAHSAATDVAAGGPAGMTNRSSGGTEGIQCADTAAPVASWSSTNDTVNASGTYFSQEFELLGYSSRLGSMGFFAT